MVYLPSVEIEPQTTADTAVIWLHGLGADGHDFEPIVPELRLPASAAVRFVFPHAPAIPVTVNGGLVMPAWYDILDMAIDRRVDIAQLMASADSIRLLIDREIERGIDSRRIVVAGFSQGGAVALQAALTYPKRLCGYLGLSTYFATASQIQPAPVNEGLPVLVCHGSEDPVVPEPVGRAGYEKLQELGYPGEYKTYPMEHAVCAEEIADISTWFQRLFEAHPG
ncbi:MAG: carboxylesterase [Gammaproteobacteria bacterium]|nr:carboxylesterase [Gammaproteobacteria bacterium]